MHAPPTGFVSVAQQLQPINQLYALVLAVKISVRPGTELENPKSLLGVAEFVLNIVNLSRHNPICANLIDETDYYHVTNTVPEF